MIEAAIQIRKLLDPLYKICDRIDIREYGRAPDNKTDAARFILTQDLFAFLKYLSAADRDISRNEIGFICSFLGIGDAAAVTRNIYETVGTVELSMSAVPSVFRKVCKYEPDKAEGVIRFFDALGRQFTASDGHQDPEEKKRLDDYIGKLRDYKANTMSAERKDFTEVKNGKQTGAVDTKNDEGRNIDLDLPFDKSVYAITNILKEPEEVREFLAYRISFIGQSLAQDGSWQDSHIVVSAAHRCIYVRPVDVIQFQIPFYEYTCFREEEYLFIDYAERLFSPDHVTENSEWFEIGGNGFKFRSKERRMINSLMFAMLLSDHHYSRKEPMYSPAKISGDMFVIDVDAKQRYGFSNEYEVYRCSVFTNITFRIYDEYMDTLASGFFPAVHLGLYLFQENSRLDNGHDPFFDYRLRNGKSGPGLEWNKGFIYDLKYQKTTRLNRSFRMFMPFDDTSTLICDIDRLTLYHTLHSYGQRCVELKFSDERQLYAFGEWMAHFYSCVESDYKVDRDRVSVLRKKKAGSLRDYGDNVENITRERLIEAGLDEERLSYYEKAYGRTNIRNVENGKFRYYLSWFSDFKNAGCEVAWEGGKYHQEYRQWGETAGLNTLAWHVENTCREFDKVTSVEADPEALTIKLSDGAVLDYSHRPPIEYNTFLYLRHKWWEVELKKRLEEKRSKQYEEGMTEAESVLAELDSLTGLTEVKKEVRKLINYIDLQKKRKEKGLKAVATSNHLVFTGNPGTGKTTVARIIARIYSALGIIQKDGIVEVSRADLVGEYLGHTAVKTKEVIDRAMGGVLFIDEAYTLKPEGHDKDFGQEAIDTLLKEMEDNRDKLVVIAAGYRDEMQRFVRSNPGLESRFNRFIDFSDYNGEELYEILTGILKKDEMVLSPDAVDMVKRYLNTLYANRGKGFANGRTVRNLYEKALKNQAERIAGFDIDEMDQTMLTTLILEDFGIERSVPTDQQLEEVFKELDSLIGMKEVKTAFRELADYVRIQKLREEKGLPGTSVSLHIVFTGNPGTGKTTVARLVGKLYHALGVLESDRVSEVTRADLVGEYLGQTAVKTKTVIDNALGGVLFIDEAYTLFNQSQLGVGDSYGQETIDTLLKAMEDNRRRLSVIVAGYRDEMNSFIRSNPGLASRFNRYIDFEDYNGEELYEILEGMCRSKSMFIDKGAEEKLKLHFDKLYNGRMDRFDNGRMVRNFFEDALVKQSGRIHSLTAQQMTKWELSRLTLEDFGIEESTGGLSETMDELMALTGLSNVKEEIRRLTATLKMQQEREKLGIISSRPSLHMVFTGSPGTGKTTVARYVAAIYKELGILSKGHLIETDRAGLVAGYMGQTALKTKEVIELAKGGVLFIDEAYTLTTDNPHDSFGQEAVDTLLKAMEDYRESLVVIVAGYDEPMKDFINSNPGLASRFNRYIHFDDYNAEELSSIFSHYCEREQFKIAPEAGKELMRYFSGVDRRSFGNGRGVRNLFEKVKSAQALRLMENSFDKEALLLINEEDVISAEKM